MAPKVKEAAKSCDIGLSSNQADLAARVLLMEERLETHIRSEEARRKAEAARHAEAVKLQKSLERQLADAVQKLGEANDKLAAAAAMPAAANSQDAARIANLEEAQKCHTQLLVKLHKRTEQLSKKQLATRLIVWWYGWEAGGWEPPGAIPVPGVRERDITEEEVAEALLASVRAKAGWKSGSILQGGVSTDVEGEEEDDRGAIAVSRVRSKGDTAGKPVMFRVETSFEVDARTILAAKTLHRDLKTGLVVRQALTSSELALQRRYLKSSIFKELREEKVALDFFRGQLHRRMVGGGWELVPLPEDSVSQLPTSI